MTMSLLSAAVVVIAVAIAAIGLGATAEDAGAEQKSRLFVVSGAALVQHGQGERDNRFFSIACLIFRCTIFLSFFRRRKNVFFIQVNSTCHIRDSFLRYHSALPVQQVCIATEV